MVGRAVGRADAMRCGIFFMSTLTACAGTPWPPPVPRALPEASVSHESVGEGQRERPVFVLDGQGVPRGLVFLGAYGARLGDEQLRLGVCRRDASGAWTQESHEVLLSEVADRDPELRLDTLQPVRARSYDDVWTIHLRASATRRLVVDIGPGQVVARQLSPLEVLLALEEERDAPRLIPTATVRRLDASEGRVRRHVLPARIDHLDEVFPLFPPTPGGQIEGRLRAALGEHLVAAAFLARPRYCDPGDRCDDMALYVAVHEDGLRVGEGGWSAARIAGDVTYAAYSAPAVVDDETVLVAHVSRAGRVTVSTLTLPPAAPRAR
ncbi:MAG TPA: hypothetical protein DEF51_36665 [Myxococcales bacterium]|nr:hypothetical protein [Myxococcales bacterium]